MKIYLENEVNAKFDFNIEDVSNQLIEACLEYEDFPYDISVEINLVDNETICEINKEYRQIDRPTDVLSFPMIEYPKAGDYSMVGEEADNFDPEDGLLMLGNIIISVDKVKEQAKEYNHSELREFGFLIVHSMLHLFGYDHEEESEAEMMFKRQEEILQKCKISRDI